MSEQTPADLDAALRPIAAALLPGWKVTAEWCASDAMPIPGALAVCSSTPTRQLAHVQALTPWPEGESLAETLWHELTHAAWSPLTDLIPESDGATMVEEQIVERFGNLLAHLAGGAARLAARAVETWTPRAPAWASEAPRLRARTMAKISARAPLARGGQMDPETIQKMIDALKAGDGESALKMCEEALVKAASGGAGVEPDGDEAKLAGKDPAGAPPPPAPAAPAPAAKMPPPATGDETARKAARLLADLERAHALTVPTAKATIVTSLRARLGAVTPATEARIMAAPTVEAAEQIAAIVEESGGGTSQRARSGVEHRAAPDTSDNAPKGEPDEKLVAEGFDEQWIQRYRARLKDEGAEAGAQMLATGRTAIARKKARVAREQAKAVAS